MDKVCLAVLLVALAAPAGLAWAENPNLFVSAGDSGRIAGSMIVEVAVRDSRISETGKSQGEPDVTINGNKLRMTQDTSGAWLGYFAHAGAARAADATVGLAGYGLDFGVFCGRDTPEETFGILFGETEGFAVPRSGGLSGYADGTGAAGPCTGSPEGGVINNVVRGARSMNTNSAVPPGQTGLDPGAWPVIQLYSFATAKILYNSGGGTQEAVLAYDEIRDPTVEVDRETYPAGAEVFVTLSDAQLNQDPTDEDSWTFAPGAVFYRAYDERGSPEAAGGPGLANLAPSLSSVGFAGNGRLGVDLGGVLELRTNGIQPELSATDGTSEYVGIITLVETSRNSGVFESADSRNKSVLGVEEGARRGLAGYLEYDGSRTGVLTGSATASFEASLTVGDDGAVRPGKRGQVVIYDPDQNLSSDRRDKLDISDPASIVPALKVGSPATLAGAAGAEFLSGGSASQARVSVPDRHSERLFVEAVHGTYDGLAIDTGLDASRLALALAGSIPGSDGNSWLSYDFGSLARHADLGGASISLEFAGGTIPIADSGIGERGLVRLESATVSEIAGMDGAARLVIRAGIEVPAGSGDLPLVADFVSLGMDGSRAINNAVYRFELEETSKDSSIFEGTIEYSVANQISLFDPGFFEGLSFSGDRIRFVITGDEDDGLYISYSDLDAVGVRTTISSAAAVSTHTGTVHANSDTFRFGRPVIITVSDPDLNLRDDISDVYTAVNDPTSDILDTVGRDGVILLEVLLKDIRYKRCMIDGVEHDGLGSAGFSLAETGPATGIFEGSFKMPSWICSRDGTELVSPAGGGLAVKYHDARDSEGLARVTGLTARAPASPPPPDEPPRLDVSEITRPSPGGAAEAVITGRIGSPVPGLPLEVEVVAPGGAREVYKSDVSDGRYRHAIPIYGDSDPGTYDISLSYGGAPVGSVSFEVIPIIPDSVREGAERWSSGLASDAEFAGGVGILVESGLVAPPDHAGQGVPGWLRSGAGWWADGTISDDEFVDAVRYLVKKGIIGV